MFLETRKQVAALADSVVRKVGWKEILLIGNPIASMIVLIVLAMVASAEIFAEIVFVSSFFGLISAAAAANNSAVIFSSISEGDGAETIRTKAKALFAVEQCFAALLCLAGTGFLAGTTNRSIGSLVVIFLCGFVASISAPLSYCKTDDRYFTVLQIVRFAATMLRFGLLIIASQISSYSLVAAAVLTSLLLPYVFSVRYTFTASSSNAQVGVERDVEGVLRKLAVEYLIGVPSALIRGAANSGVLLLSTQILPVESVKVFRLLYMPREYFGRLFGILLPLTFHRLYHMAVTGRIIFVAALVCCMLFLVAYIALFLAGTPLDTNLYLYLSWGALIGATYSLLNRQWKDVYRGRQIRNLISVLPGFVVCMIYFFPTTGTTATSNYILVGLVAYYALFVATRLALEWSEARRFDAT